MLRWIVIFIVLLVGAFAAYVRYSPANIDAIHRASDPVGVGDLDKAGSFRATRQFTVSPLDILKAIDTVIQRTSRTTLIAGSVESGMMTYETRSRVMAFPDYTTVWIDESQDGAGPHVNIRGQLRFGQADLDVNKTRIQRWLTALGPLIVAPE